MAYLFLGVGGLVLALLVVRGFVHADPAKLARTLKLSFAFLCLGIGLASVLAGRIGLGSILFGAGIAAFGAAFKAERTGRRRWHRPKFEGTKPLRSRFVEIWQEEENGAIKGTVLEGTYRSRQLEDLSRAELLSLLREARGDRASRQLVEAYLDSRFAGWREDFQSDGTKRHRRAAGTSSMTDQEAYEILGLAAGASDAEIRAAHRRLIKGVHPDRGGSAFLAAKLNEAKDLLLSRH